MANPETVAGILVTKPELPQRLQVKLRPSRQRIDAPSVSDTPLFSFTTREGNSFRFEGAIRFLLSKVNPEFTNLEIEILNQQELEALGLLPVAVRDNIIHLGEISRIRLTNIKPKDSKVRFFISLPRKIRIIDEYKAALERNTTPNGKEGTF